MLYDLYLCLLAFGGCLFVAVLYQTEKHLLIPAGFAGFLCYGVYLISLRFSGALPLATFAGALAAALYAELMAQRLRLPATSLIIMGIFPIVPGALAYDTVVALVGGQYKDAGTRALLTLILAACLAFGILLVASVFRTARLARARRKPP